MIVLTLFLVLANGAPQQLAMPGYWTGDELVPFASLAECSRLGQPIAARYAATHPGVTLDAFTCGPETASP